MAGNPTTRGSTTQSAYQKGPITLALISGKLNASDGPLTDSRYKVTADELLLMVFGVERNA